MELVSSLTYSGPEPGSPEQVQAIIEELHRLYPGAKCTLNFSTPLELLVATQLAAQCTDERVNMVTAQLFRKYRSVEDYATASQRIITEYDSEVPRTMAGLLSLAGVARKTANVVLDNAFGIVEGFTVDTHVTRLSRRFGWTKH